MPETQKKPLVRGRVTWYKQGVAINTLQPNKKVLLFVPYHPSSHPLSVARVAEFKELVRASGLNGQGLLYQVIGPQVKSEESKGHRYKKTEPATFVGKGKIQEIKEKLESTCSGGVIFDTSLSGVQIRNLEKELGVPVMDRHQLILDIFAQRARTYEGKLQVELARALDELPRMVGAWMSSLSRQGGGIGTKGPGEKAIEKDRRAIKRRVKKIRQKLEKVRQVRKGHRNLRKKNKVRNIALIGYTNSGKSSLLNALTNSLSAPVADLPFMTLDPTIRKVHTGAGQTALFTDTVGFIQNLSPHLIEAFKATLEESAEADLLLHVIDIATPLMPVQINTVHKLLQELKWDQKPCIEVYNKVDILPAPPAPHPVANGRSGACPPRVFVSAVRGEGLNNLKKAISKELTELDKEEVQLYFPALVEDKIYALTRKGAVFKKESGSFGTLCHARLSPDQLSEWKHFIVKKHG